MRLMKDAIYYAKDKIVILDFCSLTLDIVKHHKACYLQC